MSIPLSQLVVAIDGPAGAGKSTVAKKLAHELGLGFLDTGAMYRAIALKATRNGLTANDVEPILDLTKHSVIEFIEGNPQRIILDGEDITSLIRTLEIGEFASALSVHPPIRKLLAQQQREIVTRGGVTLEGRDTTTVTAYDAAVRVFLTASLEERTRRRFVELSEKSVDTTFDEVKAQIQERDLRDTTREESPLQLAEGVHLIESDSLTADDVVAQIKALAHQAMSSDA